MIEFSALDAVIGLVLTIAVLRGAMIGMIRESFSIAALGAACLAVRYGTKPGAQWLQDSTAGEVGSVAAPWIVGVAAAVGTIALVALAGRMAKRGARFLGLGMVDRIGGAALGAAEGALVGALLVIGVTWVIGPEHPTLEGSYSVAAFEEMRTQVASRTDALADLPDVAAPAR